VLAAFGLFVISVGALALDAVKRIRAWQPQSSNPWLSQGAPQVLRSSPRTVGINSETVGWMCTVFCRVVYGTPAAMTSMIE
jgi:hypothetical protein